MYFRRPKTKVFVPKLVVDGTESFPNDWPIRNIFLLLAGGSNLKNSNVLKISIFVLYILAIIVSFWIHPGVLIFLGLPLSLFVVVAGLSVINAGGPELYRWLLLLATLPYVVLIMRWISRTRPAKIR